MPEVSVIIPVYNGGRTLPEQLDSLLGQINAPSHEVIVVDDHSTDTTANIITGYFMAHPRLIRHLRTGANSGPSAARNVGAHAARGRRLLFCDADDHVRPTWVRDMANALRSRPIVTGPLDLFTAIPGDVKPLRRRDNIQDWHHVCRTASTANLGISRDLFLTLGGFDESLRAAEDVDLCVRAHMVGHDVESEGGVIGYRERTGLRATASQHGAYAFWDTVVSLRYSDLIRAAGGTAPSLGSAVRGLVAQLLHLDRLPYSFDRDAWASWLVQLWVKWNRIRAIVRNPDDQTPGRQSLEGSRYDTDTCRG